LAKAAGNTASVRSRLIVRGLIERAGSQFAITDLGQAVLTAWSRGETNREASTSLFVLFGVTSNRQEDPRAFINYKAERCGPLSPFN